MWKSTQISVTRVSLPSGIRSG